MEPTHHHHDLSHRAKWYAVHVRSNQERSTALFLHDRGVEYFLPTYRVQSSRTDRKVTLEKPLFTGYLFVHLDLMSSSRLQVLKAPGTVRIVGFGGEPTCIDDSVVESLKIVVGSGEDKVRPHPMIKEGSKVRVSTGAFKGAQGILHRIDRGRSKLVVEIEFLGRAVSVPIEEDQVIPILS